MAVFSLEEIKNNFNNRVAKYLNSNYHVDKDNGFASLDTDLTVLKDETGKKSLFALSLFVNDMIVNRIYELVDNKEIFHFQETFFFIYSEGDKEFYTDRFN